MSSHDALLKHVSIKAQDNSLVANFDIDGNIPGAGAYVVGIVASSPDHSSQRRLGIEFLNGEAIAFYSFCHDQTAEENYDLSGVTHSGNTITGNFPLAAIQGLGKGHYLTAFSEADGRDFQGGVAVEEAL